MFARSFQAQVHHDDQMFLLLACCAIPSNVVTILFRIFLYRKVNGEKDCYCRWGNFALNLILADNERLSHLWSDRMLRCGYLTAESISQFTNPSESNFDGACEDTRKVIDGI